MIETHPFEPFIPPNARYLILGSFVGKEAATDPAYDWYYGTRRNQFWPILELVYGVELRTRRAKEILLGRLGTGIADIILRCERKAGSNLDANLEVIEYNPGITEIFEQHGIETVFFTSRYVEKRFKKEWEEIISHHPDVKSVALPSPSPRYARMRMEQKAARYQELLPKL
jgi:hypoxanthine-DNA glycosylase